MDSSVVAPSPPDRTGSPADQAMRRLLRVSDTRRADGQVAERVFGTSIAISAVRCLLTYVLLPLLAPIVDLTGNVGPALGLIVGAVSAVAIVASMRRFFRSYHRWRWHYAAIGGAILVLIAVQAGTDVAALVG